jgi:hypothetical protein
MRREVPECCDPHRGGFPQMVGGCTDSPATAPEHMYMLNRNARGETKNERATVDLMRRGKNVRLFRFFALRAPAQLFPGPFR